MSRIRGCRFAAERFDERVTIEAELLTDFEWTSLGHDEDKAPLGGEKDTELARADD
jgi:hypothetical protein